MLRLKLGLCWSGKRGYTPTSFFSRGKLIEMKILSTMSPIVVCVGMCEMGRHNSSPFKKRRLTFPPHVKKSNSLGPEVQGSGNWLWCLLEVCLKTVPAKHSLLGDLVDFWRGCIEAWIHKVSVRFLKYFLIFFCTGTSNSVLNYSNQ